jgi:virulence factor Mce-like protein
MRRRGSASIAANPVLIGAATTLVVIVAVFLAYNANNGLPFVPSYSLKANVPSAANLVKGNEVRLGGTRVGVVDEITPIRHRNGTVTAQLGLKLETTVKPLPVDSTVIVRPRSALGLKYVELTKGTSNRGWPDGSTIPLTQARPRPVEIDEVLNMFNDKTRAASRVNLKEFGDALAGRGQDLNIAIEEFNPLLVNLVPVMRNLSDPRTKLPELFRALGRTAAEVAPVAETQAELFKNLDITFRAFANVARPYIQQSIVLGPPSLEAATQAFPQQRPFLRNSELFFKELRPGIRALRSAAPNLAAAFEIGTKSLARTPPINKELASTFVALQNFAEDPLVSLGVKDLTNTATLLNPTVAFLNPAQSLCNYATLALRNVASLLSEGDKYGTGQRFIVVASPQGPNNEGGPSSAPANGGVPGQQDNFLHSNPYPNTAAPGQNPKECEAGNETYVPGKQVIGNAPGNAGTSTEKTKRSLSQ